ncbi:MAG: transporter [Burkholderia sp.]|jgi:tripartite-type tricarboxylate transporter receptor subunit TctC|nr:transporter [Burkholderia sp.]
MSIWKRSIFTALVLLNAGAATLVQAQDAAADYPGKVVTIVVGFPPGTAADSVGRILGERLATRLGKNFIIDNKPGQGGSIGAAAVAKAAPDGYTLLLSSNGPLAVNPHVYPKLPYDTARDFVAVGLHSWLSYALVVNSNATIKTFADLTARAKAESGKLTYATIGNGTTSHLLVAMLMQRTGMKLTHIPYKGSGQAQGDLMGGQVDMTFDTLVSVLPHVKAGKLRALAVSTETRSKMAPDIPTLNELGVTGFNAGAWLGMLAPTGTPKPIVNKLNRELNAVLDEPETQKRLLALGAEILKGTPEEFAAYLKSEHDRWGKLVHETGAKIE